MAQKKFENMPAVYDYCKTKIYDLLFRKYKDREVAADLSSDVFASVASHAEWFIRQDGGKQIEYLKRVLKKLAFCQNEKRKKEKFVEYRETLYGESLMKNDELVFMEEDAVRGYFHGLSESEKRIMEKHYIERKTMRNIAREESRSEDAVYKMHSRAKQKIIRNRKDNGFD